MKFGFFWWTSYSSVLNEDLLNERSISRTLVLECDFVTPTGSTMRFYLKAPLEFRACAPVAYKISIKTSQMREQIRYFLYRIFFLYIQIYIGTRCSKSSQRITSIANILFKFIFFFYLFEPQVYILKLSKSSCLITSTNQRYLIFFYSE